MLALYSKIWSFVTIIFNVVILRIRHTFERMKSSWTIFTLSFRLVDFSLVLIIFIPVFRSEFYWPNISTSDPDPGSGSKNLSQKKNHF